MLKRIIKSSLFQNIVCYILYLYCRFVFLTNKIEYINRKIIDKYCPVSKDKPTIPCIFMFWHGRILITPKMTNNRQDSINIIISKHGDGKLIAKFSALFGAKAIRGSSNRASSHKKGAKDRGGSSVLRNAVKILQNGESLAITPDGPRGPRMKMKNNILAIAKITGVDIIPVTCSSSRSHIFNSWDRFMLPLPFGKITIIYGNPISIARDADEEMLKMTGNKIENTLNMITKEADIKAGIKPVEPE